MKLERERSSGVPLIDGYGNGGFRIAGQHYDGSVLVFADGVVAWEAARAEDISPQGLAPVQERGVAVELLLLGCGARLQPVPEPVRHMLAGLGIRVEPMDTGAACRTYNVLALEDRAVAAALIAV